MKFWKYQGAGNDFVMIDQRKVQWLSRTDTKLIENYCNRRFGIGADGLILLQEKENYAFEMIYFNADGRESSMCGNGGRCIAAFAQHLGIVQEQCRFLAIDGPHEAIISPKNALESWVELKMSDVQQVDIQADTFVLNTGSPHYVRFMSQLEQLDVVKEARAIRYSAPWKKDGINVNFVEKQASDAGWAVRTYERGVEDETLACGTGVTAVALATFLLENKPNGAYEIPIQAKGGQLSVRFKALGNGHFTDIWLCGPATQVFEGSIRSTT